jgi:hypothetical protein
METPESALEPEWQNTAESRHCGLLIVSRLRELIASIMDSYNLLRSWHFQLRGTWMLHRVSPIRHVTNYCQCSPRSMHSVQSLKNSAFAGGMSPTNETYLVRTFLSPAVLSQHSCILMVYEARLLCSRRAMHKPLAICYRQPQLAGSWIYKSAVVGSEFSIRRTLEILR